MCHDGFPAYQTVAQPWHAVLLFLSRFFLLVGKHHRWGSIYLHFAHSAEILELLHKMELCDYNARLAFVLF